MCKYTRNVQRRAIFYKTISLVSSFVSYMSYICSHLVVVQTECVNIDVPKKYIGCQQSQISVPVTCKIWACCEITKKQGTRSHNTYQNLQVRCGIYVFVVLHNDQIINFYFKTEKEHAIMLCMYLLRKGHIILRS